MKYDWPELFDSIHTKDDIPRNYLKCSDFVQTFKLAVFRVLIPFYDQLFPSNYFS
jgi:hypothetical protein